MSAFRYTGILLATLVANGAAFSLLATLPTARPVEFHFLLCMANLHVYIWQISMLLSSLRMAREHSRCLCMARERSSLCMAREHSRCLCMAREHSRVYVWLENTLDVYVWLENTLDDYVWLENTRDLPY
jgi:hypothetical protein